MVSSTPRPHFTPGKEPVPILQEAGWAPGPVWTGGKSRPTGIQSQTVQPVVIRFSNVVICMYVLCVHIYICTYKISVDITQIQDRSVKCTDLPHTDYMYCERLNLAIYYCKVINKPRRKVKPLSDSGKTASLPP